MQLKYTHEKPKDCSFLLIENAKGFTKRCMWSWNTPAKVGEAFVFPANRPGILLYHVILKQDPEDEVTPENFEHAMTSLAGLLKKTGTKDLSLEGSIDGLEIMLACNETSPDVALWIK